MRLAICFLFLSLLLAGCFITSLTTQLSNRYVTISVCSPLHIDPLYQDEEQLCSELKSAFVYKMNTDCSFFLKYILHVIW